VNEQALKVEDLESTSMYWLKAVNWLHNIDIFIYIDLNIYIHSEWIK